MKKYLFVILALFAFNVSSALSGIVEKEGSSIKSPDGTVRSGGMNMFLENESIFNFDETVAKLTVEIEKRAWKISATHDLQQTLKGFGKDVLPVKVFSICHPGHSGRILERDDERIVSSLMPCRVSVYTKSNGKTYISRMNSETMSANFEGLIGEVMSESMKEIEDMLSGIITK